MNQNQKKGTIFLGISIISLFIPIMIFGIPVPFEIFFPIALGIMPLLIIGMCLISKVFDFEPRIGENIIG